MEKITRKYEVPDDILALILSAETLMESSSNLPKEYRKATYDYIKTLKDLAGINEKEYLDWDIVSYKHIVEVEYEKTEGHEE
jgi:hypothetical protein